MLEGRTCELNCRPSPVREGGFTVGWSGSCVCVLVPHSGSDIFDNQHCALIVPEE